MPSLSSCGISYLCNSEINRHFKRSGLETGRHRYVSKIPSQHCSGISKWQCAACCLLPFPLPSSSSCHHSRPQQSSNSSQREPSPQISCGLLSGRRWYVKQKFLCLSKLHSVRHCLLLLPFCSTLTAWSTWKLTLHANPKEKEQNGSLEVRSLPQETVQSIVDWKSTSFSLTH